MTSKLRSHLKKTRGFTLVELLIVIAIIAILVLIVIVAINPIQRIHDTNDRRAESDVKSVAQVVEGCLAYTEPTTGITNTVAQCDSAGDLTAAATPGGPWSRNVPATVTVGAAGGVISVSAPGGTGHNACYNTTTGTVVHTVGACP